MNLTNCPDDSNRSKVVPVISDERIQQLKRLFAEDDIELSDATALEIGTWLLSRAKSISPSIPVAKGELFRKLKADTQGAGRPSRKT